MRLRGKQLDGINAALKTGSPMDFAVALQKTCEQAESVGQFVPASGSAFSLLEHLTRQRNWSAQTFGPDNRWKGVIDHIRKELLEIEAAPNDLEEWIDVVILALDGAWRSGATPEQIIAALDGKQRKNEARQWPDWRTMPVDAAITHVKTPNR